MHRFAWAVSIGVLGLSATASADPTAPRATEQERASHRPLILEEVRVEAGQGRERVVLEMTGPAQFRVLDPRGTVQRLEVRAADVSPEIPADVAGLTDGLVRSVHVVEAHGRTIIEVDAGPNATATPVRAGNRVLWFFAATQDVAHTEVRTIAREAAIPADATDSAEVAAFLSDVPLQVGGARDRRRFSGRRIDLDFKDADIHNILRLLAEVGSVNIVTSDDVTGQVTIRMRNVPWDQALDVILQAKGLGMIRRDNLIRVAPLETLEQEREAAIARMKQQEQLAPLETRLVPVSYATANELAQRVAELLTDRGSVSVDTRTNMLIVRDIVDNLDNVEELVRTLDTQTPQVLIEARIVEATTTYSRDVGIQWGGDLSFGSATGNPTGIVFPSNIGAAGGNSSNLSSASTSGLSPFTNSPTTNPNYAVNLPAAVATGSGGGIGLTLGSVGGNVNLAIRLTALESIGTVRIVSSPRILTLDNHEAVISQGTLIPYSQVSAQGVNTVFQEAILQLKVRPHVTSDGAVSMHVMIKRDEPDFSRTSVRGDPTILKRQAETDLLIPDGNTAVIGGIYTRNTARTRDQVPFFGSIPVLGVLFQRRRVADARTELLIFLTPRIVNRAEAFR